MIPRALQAFLLMAATAGIPGMFPASPTRALQPAIRVGVQDTVRDCPEGTGPRADLGIRYRFVAGDFMDEEGRPRWVHFLTEPVVTEVDPEGPAAGKLRPGDIIVAVDDYLITTRHGSARFWFNEGDFVRLHVLRGNMAFVASVQPGTRCLRTTSRTSISRISPSPGATGAMVSGAS